MMKVFAVYDLKSCQYGNPMFFLTRGVALRGFTDACATSKSPMAEHPGDYQLHELGEYDPTSGKLTGHKVPEFVASAAAVIDQIISARRAPVVPAAESVPVVEAPKEEVKNG